ncbi:predicted protein [Nematostella vectensis]|uniref:Uncharacterized protein n=1 Tax=Nematostella vectensis TaxID=45351 RepID=A7SDZ4_NEMVE|nr:predicted protein [Nematostella vectensis]|eukprot:XP_001630161.1 predicted protein [Nematostella vectensis]
MGRERLCLMDRRTSSLFSSNVAKSIHTRNAIQDKQLQQFCKNVEKAKRSISEELKRTRRNFARVESHDGATRSEENSDEDEESFARLRAEGRRKSLSAGSIPKLCLQLNDKPLLETRERLSNNWMHSELYSDKRPRNTHGCETPPPQNKLPDIWISKVDAKRRESDHKLMPKSSFNRSASTGDITGLLSEDNILAPERRERSKSHSNGGGGENGRPKHNGINRLVPPKSPCRVYSEMPFYLKKSEKSPTRHHLWDKIQHSKGDDKTPKEGREGKERPLSEILPPVVLPSLASSQLGRGLKSRKDEKLDVDINQLTKDLKDCRYLRLQSNSEGHL